MSCRKFCDNLKQLSASYGQDLFLLKKLTECGIIIETIRKELRLTMIILITGASHTGKTLLAQKFLEKYKYPYLSIDHLKMGLIRSGQTELTPYDDDKLTAYLWDILKEMIKTAIENDQNLIVEGCYIPFDWKESFDADYLSQIKYICLVMSEKYINSHFDDIVDFGNVIEKRLSNDISIEEIIQDNQKYLRSCLRYGLDYYLIDDEYDLERCCI